LIDGAFDKEALFRPNEFLKYFLSYSYDSNSGLHNVSRPFRQNRKRYDVFQLHGFDNQDIYKQEKANLIPLQCFTKQTKLKNFLSSPNSNITSLMKNSSNISRLMVVVNTCSTI